MPLQRRAAQGFAGAAVEIDLIHKGIMTVTALNPFMLAVLVVWK